VPKNKRMPGDTRFQPGTRSFRAEGNLATSPGWVGGLRGKIIGRHPLGKRGFERPTKKATRKNSGRLSKKTRESAHLF
jgi:hypothetical protein